MKTTEMETQIENRWMELARGEAYEYRLNRYASVFLFRERRKKWVAWYARWAKDRPEPIKCRDITRMPCDAKEARRQAEAFIKNWLARMKR